MNALTVQIETLKVSQMIEIARELNNDFSDAASMVIDCIMDRLMDFMPESEFVELCAELEA
jgi:hypothetical protein